MPPAPPQATPPQATPPDPIARAARLSCWTHPVDPVPLQGGLTNPAFVVEHRGRRAVVRIGVDIPQHHVSRAHELAASRAAHAASVAPAVLHAEPGALVLDFVEGTTLGPEAVRDPGRLPALVDLLRRTHHAIPRHLRGPAPFFWVFHVLRDYAHTLREGGSPQAHRLPGWLAEAEALEAAVGPVTLVFGHNDLLPANLIDDGHRLWLVDWEYAGFNSPLFDLGGLASNAGMDEAATQTLLETYLDRPVTDALRRQASAMAAASLLRESLWGLVSELHPGVAFDFAAYAAGNLLGYEAALARFRAFD